VAAGVARRFQIFLQLAIGLKILLEPEVTIPPSPADQPVLMVNKPTSIAGNETLARILAFTIFATAERYCQARRN
jgi:hypothetical protein